MVDLAYRLQTIIDMDALTKRENEMKPAQIAFLKRSVSALRDMSAVFRATMQETKVWDLGYYADRIDEMLSTDNGEAGLLSLIKILEDES